MLQSSDDECRAMQPAGQSNLNQFIHCPDENLSAIVEEVTSDLILLKTLNVIEVRMLKRLKKQ